VVHENSPHHPRRQREEMRAALLVHFPLVHQSQIRFVHERGRLEGVSPAITAKIPGRAQVEAPRTRAADLFFQATRPPVDSAARTSG
jgi:hypothetical protein